MRILFVLPYVPSQIRVRPYNFIRQLADRHEISVLAAASESELADAASLSSYCRTLDVVRRRTSTALRSCSAAAMRGEPLQAAVCRSPDLEGRLRNLLSSSDFDLVHVEHLRAAHLGAVIPRGLPTLFDSVDCISLLLERTLRSSHSLGQRLLAGLELRRTRAYESSLLRRYDRVVVTSQEDARALMAMSPVAQVDVVPNGVDLDYFHPGAGRPDAATLVMTGKMSYHANVTAALHFVRTILPLIRRVRPDVRLQIVGSNPPGAVQSLARDPAITVTGYVRDIREALSKAAVAVCPVTVKVGIQNKVLEAMAMGLPVVCTRGGASGLNAVSDRDLLVADDPAEFAAHVCRLLADASLRREVGEAGRHYVEGYHRWDAAARQLETLYSQVVDRREELNDRGSLEPWQMGYST